MDTYIYICILYALLLFSHWVVWLFCDPVDCSQLGSSIHGISQARRLKQVAISFSRGSSQPRDWTCVSCVSCIGRRILYHWATREAHHIYIYVCAHTHTIPFWRKCFYPLERAAIGDHVLWDSIKMATGFCIKGGHLTLGSHPCTDWVGAHGVNWCGDFTLMGSWWQNWILLFFIFFPEVRICSGVIVYCDLPYLNTCYKNVFNRI